VNEPGSFHCDCHPGFVKDGDNCKGKSDIPCFLQFTNTLMQGIVTRGTGYETLQVSKAIKKGAAIYIESTTTVHNLLFYVRTL